MKNLALIGTSHIHTPGFVKKLKDRKDIKVIAVWDKDESLARKNAEILGSKQFSDFHEILKDPELDAVIVCSETNLHENIINGVAEASKHCFVEKPLGVCKK